MVRVLFVCLGNICRSPMAEFLFRHMVAEAGLEDRIAVSSAATSDEALGCDIHRGAQKKLRQAGIPFTGRRARQIERRDYDRYDYLIGMERRNVSAMRRCFGGDPAGKLHTLLSFAGSDRDIADPWYTGDFDQAYADILQGCQALLERLRGEI